MTTGLASACRCGGTRPSGGACDRCGAGARVGRSKPGAFRALYKTAAWASMRENQLAREPFCRTCGYDATTADHVIPHRGNLELFYDVDNLQSLCHSCHSRKTAAGG